MHVLRFLKSLNIPTERKNADLHTNSYGYQLIEFCKNNDLFILNGRVGDDVNPPKLTCKNSSTVDYVISTAYNFDFEIGPRCVLITG